VVYARELKQNLRKLVADNLTEVEKQLQIGVYLRF
jgi:hypothetical protein